MFLVIAWLIGFLLSGMFFIFRMSGRTDLGFSTTDTVYLISIVLMSIFWPISLANIGIKFYRSRRAA